MYKWSCNEIAFNRLFVKALLGDKSHSAELKFGPQSELANFSVSLKKLIQVKLVRIKKNYENNISQHKR